MIKNEIEVVSNEMFILRLMLVSLLIGGIAWILAGYQGLSWTAVVVLIVAIFYYFITTRTNLGRHIYAVGGNPEAAELSGISVKRITQVVFGSMGMLAALAGRSTISAVQALQRNALALAKGERVHWEPQAISEFNDVGKTLIEAERIIRERDRAVADLNQTSSLLHAIITLTPDLVYVKDADSKTILTNPAMVTIGRLDSMSEKDMEDLNAYIASIDIKKEVPDFQIPTFKGDAERGKELYDDDCKTCHGKKAEGKKKKEAPPTAGQYSEYLLRQVDFFKTKFRWHDNDEEDETFEDYTDEDIIDMLTYISTLDD